MYLSNDLIDSISIEPKKIIFPGYVGSFIRSLKGRHEQLIRQSLNEPEFLIHDFSAQFSEKRKPS